MHPYPPNELKDQVRDPRENFSAFAVLKERFETSSEVAALERLRVQAHVVMHHLPDVSVHDRLARLEALVGILVRALHVKGALELEEVRREIAMLDSTPATPVNGV